MTNEERLDELLDRWEELRDQGRPWSLEELCRDCPELLAELRRRVRDLEVVDAVLRPGVLGDFRIGPEVGRGGMGIVHEAVQLSLGRRVALKRIQRRRAGDPESRLRFLQEAEITGRLEHPGVVPVYGLGHDDTGQPYYAMRLLPDQTLDDAIRQFHEADRPGRDPGERDLAFQQLLRGFLSVCQTVAYAHSRGVVHRDLKPGNIMLGKYGETLVVDWGLAKSLPQSESPGSSAEDSVTALFTSGLEQTSAGIVKGSPAYMSPEQAEGRVGEVGPSSDIYSLGATLYALLTGRPPFAGATLGQVLEKVRAGRFPRPRQVKPSVPAALEAVCLKAMALRPEDRYAGARELAADVERWLADEPVGAWREPRAARARRWLRRHRTLVTAAAAAVLVALTALGAATALLTRANRNLEAARRGEKAARGHAEQKEREAQDRLYQAHMSLLWPAFEEGNPRRLRELLEAHLPAPGRPDRRGLEWYLFWHAAHREALTLRVPRGDVRVLRFSPDGKVLAAGTERGPVLLWDLAGRPRRRGLTGHTGAVNALAFAPGGRMLATGGADATVRLWDPAKGSLIRTLRGHRGPVRALAFARDGKRLLSAGDDYAVREWDPATGTEVATRQIPPENPKWKPDALAFDPGATRLALTRSDGAVKVWEVTPGGLRPVAELKLKPFNRRQMDLPGVAFAPAGKKLFLLDKSWNEVIVCDWGTGKVLHRFHADKSELEALALAPDGRLATAGGDRAVRLWRDEAVALRPFTPFPDLYAKAAGYRVVGNLLGHHGTISCLAFAPDGKRLASAGWDGAVKVWDAEPSGEEDRLSQPQIAGGNVYFAAALSPDAGTLATSNAVGAQLTDRAGRWVYLAPPKGGPVPVTPSGLADPPGLTALAFSPDGRVLAGALNSGLVVRQEPVAAVWDTPPGPWAAPLGPRLALHGHRGKINALALAPGNRLLATAGTDRTIKLWQVGPAARGTEEPVTLPGRAADIECLAFAPGGQLLASGDADGTVQLWDLNSRQARTFPAGQAGAALALAFAPDGRTLASGDDGRVVLWDVARGTARRRFVASALAVTTCAFAPDGRRLAVGSADGRVKLWDPATGEPVATLMRDTDRVLQVGFRSDGRMLAAVTEDGRAHLWKAATEREVYESCRRRADQEPENAEAQKAFALACWGLAARPGRADRAGILRDGLAALRRAGKAVPADERDAWAGEFEEALRAAAAGRP